MKNNFKQDPIYEKCNICLTNFQKLKGKINVLTRENQTLSFMMEFKNSALKNREELIGNLVSQNQELIVENRSLKETLSNIRGSSRTPINNKKFKNNDSSTILNETKISIKKQEKETVHFAPLIKNQRSSSSDLKNSTSLYSKKNESANLRKLTQFSGYKSFIHLKSFF